MTTQQTRAEADGITVTSIIYASPKGGEVPALVVIPKGTGPFPGVIVQHGMPDTKEGMLPAAIGLARSGAVAILFDAPFNRWYDAGHFLNCAASKDMMAWLARHIRIDPRRYRYTP